jgi:hypothetical protein
MAAGNVEICFGNRWNRVCSNLFDKRDLRVACRALGFTAFARSVVDHHFIPPIAVFEAGTTLQHSLNCTGLEKSFNQCTIEAASAEGGVCVDTRIECLGREHS